MNRFGPQGRPAPHGNHWLVVIAIIAILAVQDNAGTLLLAELPNGRNMAGNDWPSFCAGPVVSTANFSWVTPA